MLLVGFPKPKLLFHETNALASSYDGEKSGKGAESRDFCAPNGECPYNCSSAGKCPYNCSSAESSYHLAALQCIKGGV